MNKSVRFQATGEKHKVLDNSPYSDEFERTECGQKFLFGEVGKMNPKPPKTNCKVCYG